MYVGYLDENISEEDLHEFFGLKSTKYLQETCKVEVIKTKEVEYLENLHTLQGLIMCPRNYCN